MRYHWVIGLFSLFWLTQGWANSAASALAVKLGHLQTLQAHFVQQITDQQGQVLQQSNGTMALQRPGKFRWQTLQPNQQLIIADGKTLWIDDEDLQQVTHRPQRVAKNSPGLLLSAKPTDLLQQFDVQQSGNTFMLTPRQTKSALFKTVTLYFTKNALSQMVLKDNLLQVTHIYFSDIQLNHEIPKKNFIFND